MRLLPVLLLAAACSHPSPPPAAPARIVEPPLEEFARPIPAGSGSERLAYATFAGGCFWCMEPPFEGRPGVHEVISGYSGGAQSNPKYADVAAGRTGHTEVVQVRFDPTVISYEQLLDIFWRSMDPTDLGGQFADRGRQYRPEIFAHDVEQARAARASRDALQKAGTLGKPIVVPVTPFASFWPAEEYHQDYYRKQPGRYKRYRAGSGRAGFLERVWGDDAAGARSRRERGK